VRVLFVHGTGVRRKRFDAVWERVRGKLGEHLPDSEFVPCYWGDDHGSSLSAGGRTIPVRGELRAGAGDAASPLDQETAEWSLLLVDPLCELRVLAEIENDAEDIGTPGVRPMGDAVADRLASLPRSLSETDELASLLRSTLLDEYYLQALDEVAKSSELADACSRAEDDIAVWEVAGATARAVVAILLADAGADAICTGNDRDRLTDILVGRLGGTARGPASRVGAVLGKLALRLTTQPVLDVWRGPLTRNTVPALGDIMRYQARGGPLREFLSEKITAAECTSVVIAHSLGGIAMVDLLAMAPAPLPGLRVLVTVGSQAAFLHELGALTGLAPGAGLPSGFPAWLNVFDRKDLLAFRAEPMFPGDDRVRDFEVVSRQPFPVSHGAYWKQPALYAEIAAVAKAVG